VLYRLQFETKFSPDVEFNWDGGTPGLNGWFSHSGTDGVLPGPIRVGEARRSEDWLPSEVRLFTHAETEALYVLLGCGIRGGEALTRRWEVVEEAVAADEGRVLLEAPSGDWAEAPHEPTPAAPAEATLWVRADPDQLRRWSRPVPEDLARALELAGTPGEMCVASVGLCTPKALAGAKLSFTEPAADAGILGASPTWQWLVWHPRRTDYYGRGRTFHYVPDFFVERPDGVGCPAGETTGFWINLRLPEDAQPGVYQGELRAQAEGVSLSVPVRVRVYPFRLAQLQGRTRHMYLDPGRWRGMDDAQVLAEIADLRDHGYESVTLPALGSVTVEAGRVTGFELNEESVRAVRLALQGGLQGPFLFWGGGVTRILPGPLGLPAAVMQQRADTWPPELAVAMVDALKLLKQELAQLGVADPVMVAVDEPGYWKEGSPERLLWDVKVAQEAGWPVFCTSSELPSDPIGQGLEYHCYGGGRLTQDPERAAFIAEQTRAAGQRLWYYCTGAYSGQIGNMLRNRYLAGFFYYRCGADGTASWTFQRPRGNPFDDFEVDERTGTERSGQPCVTYPDPEHPGRNLDTPTWEGLRQAWYDHRYAETLRQAIQAAQGRDAAAAARAERRLNELMAALPWNGDAFDWPEMTNARLADTRAALAEEITRLTAR